jgi:hypothetical protein
MAFGVSGGVITQWKSQHQEFLKAVTDAWYFIKTNGVLKALSRQATGYTLPEEKVFCNIIDGEPIVTRITVNRYYPPVPTATIFWLTNRMKQDWVHMNRLEHTGRDGKPIQTEDKLTQTLLRELLSKSSPEALTTLKDTLEDIVCANSEPL